MNILSLFNGISGLHLACDRAGLKVDNCYYSEIDKYANQVTQKNYPDDIALGDVTKWREWNIDWSSIDLVGAGFPCQSWSLAGQQLGDKDERGMLFWTTLEIIKHVLYFNPNAKFLMENVKMKKEFEEYITHHTTQALGYVEKTLINSALVSAQNRNRYYWTNFEVTQPRDKGILLKDILEDIEGDRPCDRIKDGNQGHIATATDIKGMDCIKRVYGQDGKSPTLTTMGGGHREPKVLVDGKMVTLTATIYKQPPQYAVSGIKKVTNVNPSGRGMNGNVYHTDAKSPTLTTNKGEGIKITGGAIRGRYNGDGTISQRLELNGMEKTNTLTTVQKDNVVVIRPASIVGRRLNDRGVRDDYNKDVAITQCLQVKHKNEKTGCLTTVDKDNVLSTEPPGRYPDIYNRCDITYRKLTPTECARLQTFPDGWCESVVSKTQSYKAYGNSWTIDVIAHILKGL